MAIPIKNINHSQALQENETKENDASRQKKKRPAEASTKAKKKREEASVIARHPALTLQVSLLSQLVQGQFSVSWSVHKSRVLDYLLYTVESRYLKPSVLEVGKIRIPQ